VIAFASRAYVPGPLVDDAMLWVRRMDQEGVAASLGYFYADGDAPTRIAEQNLAAIEALASQPPNGSYVSFKVPALHYDAQVLEDLARAADRHGQLIHFDSHGPETASPTIEALSRLAAPGRRLSLSMPSRWARSAADAEWAVANAVRVRVVKGEWACPDRPDADRREGYLDIIDRLAGRASAVAVATHNDSLAREALRRLQAAGTPCELELLCGLPRRRPMAVARELGVPMRLYIPFGQAWLPYALNQAMRNPTMLWWIARDTLTAMNPITLSASRGRPTDIQGRTTS
jgi:proline dehydrogenase